jgi:hypothetical protein
MWIAPSSPRVIRKRLVCPVSVFSTSAVTLPGACLVMLAKRAEHRRMAVPKPSGLLDQVPGADRIAHPPGAGLSANAEEGFRIGCPLA